MIAPIVALALLLQVAPGKASISGVAVRSDTGEPIGNARVSLTRTDMPVPPVLSFVLGNQGAPPAEITVPGEFLASIMDDAPPEILAGMKAAGISAGGLAESDIKEITIGTDGAVGISTTLPLRTDSEGKFAFEDLTPGTYRLTIAGNGYVRQQYGQRTSGSAGSPIILNAGQTANVAVRMVPAGAVSGRIRDSSGQPVAGAAVQLFRFAYNATGQRSQQSMASARTDDHGEYRMFFVTPGRYYLQAIASSGNIVSERDLLMGTVSMSGANASGNRIPESYPSTYYPGVADANASTPIDVQSNADLKGLDLILPRQQLYKVRGRVVDPRTGQPPPSAGISLNPQTPVESMGGMVFLSAGTSSNYNRETGTFEFRDVTPGIYGLSVSLPIQAPPNAAALTPAERTALNQQSRPSASVTLSVVNADVDAGLVTLVTGSPVSGRVRMDQGAFPPSLPMNRLRVLLRKGTSNNSGSSPGADGVLRIDNVMPGEYQVSVMGLPPGFFVKEIKFGDTDALNSPLRFAGADPTLLDIVISGNVSQIDGLAADDTGQPVPGAQVVLIPTENRDRTERFKPATAGGNGRFAISNISPGSYKLFAWESLEPYAFFDPDLLKQVEEKGRPVQVMESSKQTVDVRPIPASGP